MIVQDEINGHPALWLENDLLKLAVLPEKGADIYELIHKPSGVQFLMKNPAGLRPPTGRPQTHFLENYEGAWQELFPNHNDVCEVNGVPLPFHGEVALLPWDFEVLRDDQSEIAVRFSVRCRQMPFTLERVMRLRAGSPVLELEGTVTNESESEQPFVWGHHVVLGGDFLEEGCQLDLPATTIHTPEVIQEEATARLAPGQMEPWPLARGRKEGERFDLSRIPGPQAHRHDDTFTTGLRRGELAVTNPRLGLRFQMVWDELIFPWVVVWQPFGGAEEPPLTGIYGLGIEPWVARYPLAQAIQEGQARWLGGRDRLSTRIIVCIEKAVASQPIDPANVLATAQASGID
jgi:galactose mutarotase-like enzyme